MPTVFDKDGHRVFVSSDVPVNDLTQAPRYMDSMPSDTLFVPVVVPAADGTPRLALVNPTLLATTDEVLEAIATARQGLVDENDIRDAALAAEVQRINTLQGTMSTTQASMATLIAQLAARKAIVPLPDVVVSQTAGLVLSTGERSFNVACAGIVKATDTLLIVNKNAYPAGYGLRGYSAPSNDNLSIVLQCPGLALGASFSIPFAVYAIR